jgi:hypothetical protein
MATYSVQLDRPNATKPRVCWRVWTWDLAAGGRFSDALGNDDLYVPELDAWIPDTLRLVLYELSAYLPAHDPADALVRIDAKLDRPRGRPPKVPRPALFDPRVKLSVEARGWRVEVQTWNDDRPLKAGAVAPYPGSFSEPMQAFLLDLAAQSPFPLAHIRRELSASDDDERGNDMPSRLNVQLGDEAPWDPVAKKWRHDMIDLNVRVRKILDQLRDRLNGSDGGAQ